MLPKRIVATTRLGGTMPACAGKRAARQGRAAFAAALIAAGTLSFAALTALPSAAAYAADRDGMVAVPKPLDLDGLFEKLKQAPDASSAAITSHAIAQRWAKSGSDTADLLMQRADAALAAGEQPLAIEILDRVLVIEPDWAEAWNRRATVFFLQEDLSRSAADIQEVLAREPRHFGALMGLGGILERIGDDRKALIAYQRVLAIYPLLPAAQKAVERLTVKVGDTPI
ncbi:Tetratricopeptide repeat-containing protein [Rhizobiales bacterium GAS191]|nr:Tetratricopeptide repeat-containing protein [Rhizobiales bacterium GAS191]SEC99635.1 Tetratricopeptide repeat-containing protein [Rhizobiales bacterium GAS188]